MNAMLFSFIKEKLPISPHFKANFCNIDYVKDKINKYLYHKRIFDLFSSVNLKKNFYIRRKRLPQTVLEQ